MHNPETKKQSAQINHSKHHQSNPTNNQNGISIFAHNVNGLLTKTVDSYSQVNAADFEVYMLTETRLNDSVFSCYSFPPNDFEVYRCDRSDDTSQKKGGGGVLISVNKKYKSELIKSGEYDGCEQIWVQINNEDKKN